LALPKPPGAPNCNHVFTRKLEERRDGRKWSPKRGVPNSSEERSAPLNGNNNWGHRGKAQRGAPEKKSKIRAFKVKSGAIVCSGHTNKRRDRNQNNKKKKEQKQNRGKALSMWGGTMAVMRERDWE